MSTEQILERLMREYGDSVFRMCFLYLKDYHLAEDATQGTFMKAMKKLKDYFELHLSLIHIYYKGRFIGNCKSLETFQGYRVYKNDKEAKENEEIK